MYNPLPKNLTIKKSKINGLGIFATEDIKSNINLEYPMLKVLQLKMDIGERHLGDSLIIPSILIVKN